MLQQRRIDDYYKVTCRSQRQIQIKRQNTPVSAKGIQDKKKKQINAPKPRKAQKKSYKQSSKVPVDYVTSNDVEIIEIKNEKPDFEEIINIKTMETMDISEKNQNIHVSHKDTVSMTNFQFSDNKAMTSSNNNYNVIDTSIVDLDINNAENTISITSYSQLSSPKKLAVPNNRTSVNTCKKKLNMSPQSKEKDTVSTINYSQSPNSKRILSPTDTSNIRKIRKMEPESPRHSPKVNSSSPKTPISPQKSYTPKKSSPFKRSSSFNKVTRRLFSELIDWELTVQVIENLNLAKQGAIHKNNFNLEKIYASNNFRFSYGDINPMTSVRYEISDIVMPTETYAAYLFMMIVNVFSNPVNCGYFDESELDFIFSLMKLSEKAQMLLARMLRRKRSWHRLNSLQYPEISDNLQPIFEELTSKSICISDIRDENISVILDLLQVDEIRKICQELKIPGNGKKYDNISQLLKLSNKSKPLFPGLKTATSALHKLSLAKLGYCVCLTTKMSDIFDRILTLLIPNLEPDKTISDVFLMFLNIQQGATIFPVELPEERFPIFSDKNHLVEYVEARKIFFEILAAIEKKHWDVVREKGQLALEKVSMLLNTEFTSNDIELPDYIKRYMPIHTWFKIMSKSVDAFKKSKETLPQAELILRTLLNQNYSMHRLKGKWYAELILINMHHKKELEAAANITIEALNHKGNFMDTDKKDVAKKANMLVNRKSGGISIDTKSKIQELLIDTWDQTTFKFTPICNTIEANLVRGNSTNQKSKWIINDGADSQVYTSVENVALNYYHHQNYTNGMHCEGALPITLFAILFWEELYSTKIPGTWLTVYQYAPEDLFSQVFYENRKAEIDLKLNMFHQLNSTALGDLMENKFNMYCNYTSLIQTNVFKNGNEIKEIVECLGVDGVIRLCERLIDDYKLWKSGFPDLIVWNPETKKYKIVEVKGPNDSLSTKQELWLEYLHQSGLDAEVCIVKAAGNVKARMA